MRVHRGMRNSLPEQHCPPMPGPSYKAPHAQQAVLTPAPMTGVKRQGQPCCLATASPSQSATSRNYPRPILAANSSSLTPVGCCCNLPNLNHAQPHTQNLCLGWVHSTRPLCHPSHCPWAPSLLLIQCSASPVHDSQNAGQPQDHTVAQNSLSCLPACCARTTHDCTFMSQVGPPCCLS